MCVRPESLHCNLRAPLDSVRPRPHLHEHVSSTLGNRCAPLPPIQQYARRSIVLTRHMHGGDHVARDYRLQLEVRQLPRYTKRLRYVGIDRALHRGHSELKLRQRSWLRLYFQICKTRGERPHAPEKPRYEKRRRRGPDVREGKVWLRQTSPRGDRQIRTGKRRETDDQVKCFKSKQIIRRTSSVGDQHSIVVVAFHSRIIAIQPCFLSDVSTSKARLPWSLSMR